jgi:broad specificity phosphatase PhoE
MGATELWLVRHGESTANAAAARAESAGAESIDAEARDADVPLSQLGERQAEAFGDLLRESESARSIGVAWVSPYLRAQQTLSIALAATERELPIRIDERLRDRELGVLDLLTSRGVESRFPAEAARRKWLGKFYYRPPGGESWADVALRLRSVLRDIDALHDERVLIATHDAVVLLFVYICTEMTEQQLLDFALEHTVGNASVTTLIRPSGAGAWALQSFAQDAHLEQAGVHTTEHPGDKDAIIH